MTTSLLPKARKKSCSAVCSNVWARTRTRFGGRSTKRSIAFQDGRVDGVSFTSVVARCFRGPGLARERLIVPFSECSDDQERRSGERGRRPQVVPSCPI